MDMDRYESERGEGNNVIGKDGEQSVIRQLSN